MQTGDISWKTRSSLSGWLVPISGNWKVDLVRPEVSAILGEIERALNAKLYYVAIAVSLSIPDICACLECDPDKPIWATSAKYIAWCDANIAFRNLDGEDLFHLRGGVLHQGHFGHPKSKFNRVLFIGPESQIKIHDVVVTVEPNVSFGEVSAADLRMAGKILQLDVIQFCETIMDAARKWASEKRGDPFVERNLANLVRFRPGGLPPFSVGVPTIA